MGRDISDEEIAIIMKMHDSSGDQALSLEEFKRMITDE